MFIWLIHVDLIGKKKVMVSQSKLVKILAIIYKKGEKDWGE
jgi:hypothetical protein